MERPSAAGRWLDRNAKWVILVGLVLFLGRMAAWNSFLLNWIEGNMRGTPAYRMALQELRGFVIVKAE